jgi:hypothetical protein
MESAVNKKSGKGISDGVISELAAYFDVKPGHEEELRAAVGRFAEALRRAPLADNLKTGLRDTRHVIFDDGRRLLWCTTFDTDWDPYVDDAILIIGADHFYDWIQHTTAFDDIQAWLDSAGGAGTFDKNRADAEDQFEEIVKNGTGGLKAILQAAQTPAASYFNTMSALTMTQIFKAQRLQEAFQQVLDDPAAEEALQHPALKPLLEQAAD